MELIAALCYEMPCSFSTRLPLGRLKSPCITSKNAQCPVFLYAIFDHTGNIDITFLLNFRMGIYIRKSSKFKFKHLNCKIEMHNLRNRIPRSKYSLCIKYNVPLLGKEHKVLQVIWWSLCALQSTKFHALCYW